MIFLPEYFQNQSQKLADDCCFLYHQHGQWRTLTWADYSQQVQSAASVLKQLGVGYGDRVAILSANRPEWMIADLAILWIGAVSVPIYATSSSDDVRYIAEHSGAKVFFTDHADRAEAIKEHPLSAIVFFDEIPKGFMARCPVRPWSDFSSTQKKCAIAPLKADDFATIVYTSGTTGRPKGVVHTHGNIVAVMQSLVPVLDNPRGTKDRFFSFLPLSHVAERVLVQIGSILTGSEVAFARSVSHLADDLTTCRPTILLCVPRLWEKMHERIEISLKKAKAHQRVLFRLAQKLGSGRIQGNEIRQSLHVSFLTWLGDRLVGAKLRKKLGLDRARLLVTGSAPTRRDVLCFFAAFGLFIREVYGLSENLCLGVYQPGDVLRIGSCGRAFQGNEVKIADDGEILFRAPWNFREYYQNETATREAYSEGWLATGDLGTIDSDGFLSIVGRKKELLKTSTGKYVAPVPLEDQIKTVPGVTEVMVVGDNEKYCIALVALEVECNKETIESVLCSKIDAMNACLAHHESIKRVGILKKTFSIEDGTLTPTLKLKRKVITERYSSFVQQLYAGERRVMWEI